jgi:hypothetical protein
MLAAAALGLVTLGGVALTYLWDDEEDLLPRICSGAAIGQALWGLVGLVLASWLGVSVAVVLVAAFVAGSALIVLAVSRHRATLSRDLRALLSTAVARRWRFAFGTLAFAALAGLLWRLMARSMIESGGAILTGVEHNLGDLPFHLSILTSLAWGENLPPEHPELVGARLTYPFLADLVAAHVVKLGAGLRGAYLMQGVVLLTALAGLLVHWGRTLTNRLGAAILTPVLFLASGGLGFLMLPGETSLTEKSLVGLLQSLTHDYTILRTGTLRWGNVVTTLLLPQRSLLLGLPLFLTSALLLFRGLQASDSKARRLFTGAGVVGALLPLAHVHGFAVLLAVSTALFLGLRRKDGACLLAPALALAVPQIVWLAWGSSLHLTRFIGLHFGWDRGAQNAAWFWAANAGLFLPLYGLAILFRPPRSPRHLMAFQLAFVPVFVLPNLLRLSPWIWDNVKFLVYWFLAAVPLVALLLCRLWRKGVLARIATVLGVGLLTLSGALDLWRVASAQIELRIFDAPGVRLARTVLASLPSRAVVLHAPTYDSPVYLSGRRSVLGYPGHIWSQGLDAGSREADIREIYSGGPDAQALIARYGVDYILVGPREWTEVPLNERFLSTLPRIATVGPYRLYRARP